MQQVIYTLLNYINNTITQDTNYYIALTILNQINQMEHYSLEKMALTCHVSPATINRFCKQIGYSNYSRLRKVISHKETKTFDKQLLDDIYMQDYLEAIYENINAINTIDINYLDRVLACLNKQKRCMAMGYGSYQNYALDLQKNFFSCGKFIEVYIDQIRQFEALKTMGKDDIVIITSLGGRFIETPTFDVLELIKQNGCKSILITQITNEQRLADFDYVIECGRKDKNHASKYAIIRLYDLLANRYQQLYKPVIVE